ncbi:cupin domain-containing protein [Hymenobacter properus]|uniref:Cupin domain-containing protein n=1 Tax=Hymenobacter properus TaxID=2791026 RepID=A0A931BEA5_9BACT|nr:cupin domain-containing protein [Hymenobacter properus]MBF9141829.1 cupin domain-containing protein [Hymenobacter properus]MBR7720637.1 cupin domain-containing protein [Microvirga sp. SRT04]
MEIESRRTALKALSATAIGMALAPHLALGAAPGAPKKPFVLRLADARAGEHYHLMGFDLFLKVSAKDSDGQMSMFSGVYRKHDGPPLHVHYEQDEEFYITEGEFLVQVGEERYTLKAGDLIFLPRNIPHTFLTLSDTGRMVFMTHPSGKTEQLFKQLAALPPTATPDDAQKIHIANQCRIVGPKLTVG